MGGQIQMAKVLIFVGLCALALAASMEVGEVSPLDDINRFGATDSMAKPAPKKVASPKKEAPEKEAAKPEKEHTEVKESAATDDIYTIPPAVSPEKSLANMKKWEKQGLVKWDGTHVKGSVGIMDVGREPERMRSEERSELGSSDRERDDDDEEQESRRDDDDDEDARDPDDQ